MYLFILLFIIDIRFTFGKFKRNIKLDYFKKEKVKKE